MRKWTARSPWRRPLIELADAQFSAINDIVKRRQAEGAADFAANPATELDRGILLDMLARLLPEHPRMPGPLHRQDWHYGKSGWSANGARTVADAEELFPAPGHWSYVVSAWRMVY